jgi:preprotein translocase subunit Sec63
VHFLFDIAIADSALDRRETDIIFAIAGWLNINDIEYRKIKSAYSIEKFTHYTIFGVSQHATFEEVKAAYRSSSSSITPIAILTSLLTSRRS